MTDVKTPRRTQEQRTAQTRGKLLDATIASLLDVGYAQTTTRHVALLAGVSAGAQTHHFPYRVDLVAAAIERLAEQRIEAAGERIRALPASTEDRVGAILDVLWADLSSDLFTVFVKVWVAAADDRELHARLVPIERQVARAIQRNVVGLLDQPPVPEFDATLTTVLATMRGLALTERFEPRARSARDPWPAVRATLQRTLQAVLPPAARE